VKEKEMEATVEAAPQERTHEERIPTKGARELLGERGILRIEHAGDVYTLRITRNNRLILTK
jgi:hemin uptake protein HemP